MAKWKYGNQKASFKGEVLDSRYERDRYMYLFHLCKHGDIQQLRRQVCFTLITKTTRVVPVLLKTKTRYDLKVVEQDAQYHCDFLYIENGKYICEEFKSEETAKLPDYILRRKLMVKKIYNHNAKGRSQWVFREVVYSKKGTIVTDR